MLPKMRFKLSEIGWKMNNWRKILQKSNIDHFPYK